MDLLKEALDPGFVTVEVAGMTSVRALSLEDTVGLKARAWHDRFVIRDIIDLHAAAGTFSYMGLCRSHRTGVRRAEPWHLPAGAGPTDHRRARCHRSPADRDSRAAP